MSPRHPGHDEAGRPIVAELGRAETPQETADRKAAASLRHRSNQTAINLGIAVFASLLVVAFLVMVVVRPDQTTMREPVDYAGATEGAQSSFDGRLLVPELEDGWTANYARMSDEGGVEAWQIGFLSPDDGFIQLTQAFDTNPSWLDDQVRGADAGPTVEIGGVTWTSYDRRAADDPGLVAAALSTGDDAATIVLTGTASDADFEELAAAVAQEIDR